MKAVVITALRQTKQRCVVPHLIQHLSTHSKSSLYTIRPWSMMAASSAAGGVSLILKKEGAPAVMTTEESVARAAAGISDKKISSEANGPLQDSNAAVTDDSDVNAETLEQTKGPAHEENNNDCTFREAADTNSMTTGVNEIPSGYAQCSTEGTQEGISVEDDAHVVDAALLSALSDRRERVALLRLEQTLVDFMKDTSQTSIQVGGFSNSTVIYNQADGVMTPPRASCAGKQTKFQRLCLHRLADRFCILRETDLDSEFNGGPGLIRLIKVADSKIPKHLLIDLVDNQEDEGQASLTRNLSGLALAEKPKTPQRKMKIMKRGSSSFGSSGSLKDKSNKSSNNKGKKTAGAAATAANKGKNLSDKEKAYAAARARIFNNEQAVEGDDQRASMSSNVGNSAVSSAFSSAYTSPSTTPPPPANMTSWSPASLERSALLERAALDLPPSLSDEQQCAQTPPPQDRPGLANSSSSNTNNNRPAAATGGGVSKVTWRNRKQEESDPDFQTRHRMQGATTTGGLHEYGQNAYPSYHQHAPQHYYAGQPSMTQTSAAFYPAQHGQAYFHSSLQQQHAVMTPPGSGSSTPNRASAKQRQRGGGYGANQASNDINTGSTNDFPALG